MSSQYYEEGIFYLIELLRLLLENVEDILIDLRIVIRGGHVAQYSPVTAFAPGSEQIDLCARELGGLTSKRRRVTAM
jgi:hypothetical protein